MDELINKIFNIVKDDLYKGIDYKYFYSMEMNYRLYLKEILKNIKITDSNFDQIVSNFSNREKNKLENSSDLFRLQRFAHDENFIELDKLSCLAYKCALNKCSGQFITSQDEANINIELMKKYCDNVFDFNKEMAKELLSEGILDYKYAAGESNDMSFRLAKEIKKDSMKTL